MQTFLTTPFPFPLVQMTRTFLFFYVFTVPFALLHDVSIPIAHCVVIFFLTYGFMGLEYVSIELDDPFGSDDNDFQNLRYAQTTFEDCYAIILQMDGPDWADKLRLKMHDPYREDELPKEALEWLMVHSSNKRQSSPKR
jgi:predicted membrane chloride channel (bestrophin family)